MIEMKGMCACSADQTSKAVAEKFISDPLHTANAVKELQRTKICGMRAHVEAAPGRAGITPSFCKVQQKTLYFIKDTRIYSWYQIDVVVYFSW